MHLARWFFPAAWAKGEPMDSIGALNVFVRAAEARSFTNAGRQLGLSSSAVGKAVARLEDRLTVRLFHRNTRCVTLTQEGVLFLESCQRIVSEVKAVECEFAQTKGTPRGKLLVGVPFAGTMVMPVVENFMLAYPDIEVDLDFSARSADLIECGFDVVLRSDEMSDSRLMSRCLGCYRFKIVGSPAYFARNGVPSVPAELASHACLHLRHPAHGKPQRWPFVRSPAGGDIAIPTKAACNTLEPLVSMAEAGLGIACVPDFAIRRQLSDGALVSVLAEFIESREVLRAVWPSSRYLSPRLRVFIDFMVAHLPSLLASKEETNLLVAAEPQRHREKLNEAGARRDAAVTICPSIANAAARIHALA
jgi:DNA-binding transcriptional LysR family regulator